MAKRNASNLDRFFWGFLMIGLGILFLLDQMGYVEFGSLRRWWPAIVILMGLAHLVRPRRVKDVGHGVMWVLFGLWFLAADRGWHGLTWNNSWPLALVGVGASIVAEVIMARAAPDRPEGDEDVRQIS
jgi:hypothetical protein